MKKAIKIIVAIWNHLFGPETNVPNSEYGRISEKKQYNEEVERIKQIMILADTKANTHNYRDLYNKVNSGSIGLSNNIEPEMENSQPTPKGKTQPLTELNGLMDRLNGALGELEKLTKEKSNKN